MYQLPACCTGLRHLHHRIKCKTSFRRACHISGRTLCGVYHLSFFLCGVYGAVPPDFAGRINPEVFSAISALWRYALSCQHSLCRGTVQAVSARPFQLRSVKGYCETEQNQRCGLVGTDYRLCDCQCGHHILCNIPCKIPQERAAHRCAGNHSQLHQILLRCLFVLSSEAGRFAGQTAPCLKREILHCRSWHPGSSLWR